MKPLQLEIEAFGSFADRQTIDFDGLGEHRLFLIHGPTGAGKSTILEAICFALYGAAPGASDSAAVTHLRSQHAEPDRLTRIVLDFELGSERYRVERTPRQLRPKKRGDGFIEERGTAVLYRWKGEASRWKGEAAADAFGEPLATKQGDVDAQVRELLGLDRAQFRQVILLPQGKFRRLLEASSQERQEILSKLFDIDRYADLERRLKAAADRLRDELGGLERERGVLLGQAEAESEDAFAVRRKALETEVEAARKGLELREQESVAARKKLEQARSDAQRIRARDTAKTRFEALTARQPEYENLKLRLRDAERAEPVVLRIDARTERAAASEAAKSRLSEADARLAAAAEQLEAARNEEFAAREREPELTKLAEQGARLTAAGKQVDALETARATERAQTAELEASGPRAQKALSTLEKCQAEITVAETAAARQVELASERQALTERLSQLEEQHRRAERESRLRTRLGEIDASVETLDLELAALNQKVEFADQAYRTAAAAERAAVALRLAESLVEGEECAVCGSTAHPAPAHLRDKGEGELAREGGSAPDVADLEACEAALAAARAELVEPTQARAGLLGERAAQRSALEESAPAGTVELPPVEVLGESIRETRTAREAASVAIETSERAVAALVSLRERAEAARGAHEKIVREEAGLSAALEALRTSIVMQEEALPAEARTRKALTAAIEEVTARHRGLAERIEQTSTAANAAASDRASAEAASTERRAESERAAKALVAAQGEVLAAIAAAAFDSEQAVEEARLSAEERAERQGEVEAFNQDLEAARQGLALATTAAEGAEAADLASLEERFKAADLARAEAQDAVGVFRTQSEGWAKLAAALDELKARSGNLGERYKQVGALANVASGDNPERVSFQRFVLAAFLDEVLALATISLRRMSKGRYDLRRVTQLEDRRRRAGLDLAVWDAHTGQERPVSTLSGGESFCAALALALGLAEVVQRHSGGTRLDAIFVDEGFGSLDPESLELALETLVELQSGGRLVGLISHVPELQERIETRIEVRPGRGGSVLAVTLP